MNLIEEANDQLQKGVDWVDEYDHRLMMELERLTSIMNTIDMKDHFEGVAQEIACRMSRVYGRKINERCVRQWLN